MKSSIFKLLIPVILLAVMMAGCSVAAETGPVAQDPDSNGNNQPPQQVDIPDFSPIVDEIRPSVVAIDVRTTTSGIFSQGQTIQAAGTGWVFDSDGYIVTNQHVIEGADEVTITLDDGRTFTAQEIMEDAVSDIAVLRVDADDLDEAPIGDVSELDVGDWVCAIGNSLGLGISTTVGVVSSKDSSLQEASGQLLGGLIQTDAAINPGNSGGPLVNTSGEVVGITSIKVARSGIEGMGYAIAIDEALPIIETLIDQGFVVRPYLGINAVGVTPAVASRFDLPVDSGVLITSVSSGTPADRAGLEAGDVIVSMGDQEVNTVGQLLRAINSYEVGDTVTVTYYRDEEEQEVEVQLEQAPTTTPSS